VKVYKLVFFFCGYKNSYPFGFPQTNVLLVVNRSRCQQVSFVQYLKPYMSKVCRCSFFCFCNCNFQASEVKKKSSFRGWRMVKGRRMKMTGLIFNVLLFLEIAYFRRPSICASHYLFLINIGSEVLF
jgi:hypothetical protein